MRWFIIILFLVGCSTPKNTQKDTNFDYSSEIKGVTDRMDSLMINFSLIRKETTEKLSNIKLENRTTYLSLPDSMGRQYPTIISETKSEQEDKEKSTVDAELKATIEELNYKVNILYQQFKAIQEQKEKVVKLSLWDRYKSDIVISIIVIAVIWMIISRKMS